jgi:hypothetical protein
VPRSRPPYPPEFKDEAVRFLSLWRSLDRQGRDRALVSRRSPSNLIVGSDNVEAERTQWAVRVERSRHSWPPT